METTGQDFLSSLFDRGLGVFDRLADYELGKREIDLARDYAMMQGQAQRQAAPSTAGPGFWTDPAGVDGPSSTRILIGVGALAAVGLGLYLALR